MRPHTFIASLKSNTLAAEKTKRLFDILFSLFVLLLLFPLFAAIALAIMCCSKGSPFYAQWRLGKGGRLFKCYKFRTMHRDAEARLKAILAANPAKKHEWLRHQKLQDDPRTFPLGRFLRRISLDELPQFFNVLRGDLSVVGPRPYMLSQRGALGAQKRMILSVRPGITGLWQTSGRSQTTFKKRIELDAQYVQNATFAKDVRLILKTVPQVILMKDAS